MNIKIFKNRFCKASGKQRGFTLVELVVYMALMSLLMVTITDLFVGIVQTKVESESSSAVERDGQLILARLRYDISRATEIDAPSLPGASGSILELKTSGPDYTYILSGSNLLLYDSSTHGLPLNSTETKVTNLSFTKVDNPTVTGTKDTIQVNLTLESLGQVDSRPESRTYQTTFGRRE